MKPLAMSFQLVLDENKRIAAEIEIILEDGTIISRLLPANEKLTVHFEDLIRESIRPPPA